MVQWYAAAKLNQLEVDISSIMWKKTTSRMKKNKLSKNALVKHRLKPSFRHTLSIIMHCLRKQICTRKAQIQRIISTQLKTVVKRMGMILQESNRGSEQLLGCGPQAGLMFDVYSIILDIIFLEEILHL